MFQILSGVGINSRGSGLVLGSTQGCFGELYSRDRTVILTGPQFFTTLDPDNRLL